MKPLLLFLAAVIAIAPGTARAQSGPSVSGPGSLGPSAPNTYTLGPGDQILIRAVDLEEIDPKQPVSIDSRGNINLPLAGRIQAAGETTEELESEIETRLTRYVKHPSVTVSLSDLRSQPVSVLGFVQTPGVHQLQGEKTLFEVLSLAGGLRPDAGNVVKITRQLQWGRIPLDSAADDPSGEFSVATVDVKSIMSATSPAQNILIRPNDVITVPKADIVYVVGSVVKPGGFVLGENTSLSTLQVISLAAGLNKTAASDNAKILRTVAGSSDRKEIPVDLKKILSNKAPDVPLLADDILFIPDSAVKAVGLRSIEAAIQVATYLAIYRP